jgi:exopolysaccharide biosynthesis predicted pyruvyltransferase EpsI
MFKLLGEEHCSAMSSYCERHELDLQPNENMLRELAAEKFLFVANPGNAGDAAIACATLQAFAAYGCNYRMTSIHCSTMETRDRVVVFGGGGNLVPYYSDARRFLLKHHRTAKRLILLPHTVRGHEDVLSTLGQNVLIYCRELPSLQHVQAVARFAEARFAHDLALVLDVSAAMRFRVMYKLWGVSPRRLYRQTIRPAMMKLTYLQRNRRAPQRLDAFRRDHEQTASVLPDPNLDVSDALGKYKGVSPIEAHAITRELCRFLARFDEVHTNRLHVSILAGLLGREVHLYDNAYGKNGDVYRASLQSRFPNVQLRDMA